jgi:DNA-binding NtrC family response regulator
MTTQAYSVPQPKDIPQAAVSETKLVAPPGAGELDLDECELGWPTLALLSRRYIDRALLHTQGNKTRAAELLGIDRRTLNRILTRDRVRRSKPE